jgi:hypothetical protein
MPAQNDNVGHMDQMPHTAMTPSVAGLSLWSSPYAEHHGTPQQRPQIFPFQPPMVNQPMIANPHSGGNSGRNNARSKEQQGPPETAIVATSTPEFPSLEAFLEQRSSQETYLHPCDYVFKEYTDKPLQFTAVELITFLPELCTSLGICARLLKAKMNNTAHWQISTTHRSTEKNVRQIGNDYLNAMRRRDPSWSVKDWLKSWKPPRDWVCVMEMRDFEPDRVVYEESQAPVPMPVPFTDLLRGVEKCPTGCDAADLTRAIDYACEQLEKDGTVYVFPTDLEKILDEAGRTVVTPDHRDDMIIKRYYKQYDQDRLAKNNAGQKRAASPTPPPQAQLPAQFPAQQPKRQKMDAATQKQPVPQKHMEKDPRVDGLMQFTEVRGDETAEVNRLIRFAQRPDQMHFPWQWKAEHVERANAMLQEEANIVQKEKMVWDDAIRRDALQGDAQQHDQNNVSSQPAGFTSQFQDGSASDLEFGGAIQDVQPYDQTPGLVYSPRNDHSSSPESAAEWTNANLMTPNESEGMVSETPASSLADSSYVNFEELIDPALLDEAQSATVAEHLENIQGGQDGDTEVNNPSSMVTVPSDFDTENSIMTLSMADWTANLDPNSMEAEFARELDAPLIDPTWGSFDDLDPHFFEIDPVLLFDTPSEANGPPSLPLAPEHGMQGHAPNDLLRECHEAYDASNNTPLARAARFALEPQYIDSNWRVQELHMLLDKVDRDALAMGNRGD